MIIMTDLFACFLFVIKYLDASYRNLSPQNTILRIFVIGFVLCFEICLRPSFAIINSAVCYDSLSAATP